MTVRFVLLALLRLYVEVGYDEMNATFWRETQMTNKGVLAMKRSPTHPGQVLQEMLKDRQMSVTEAARRMGNIPAQRVHNIIKGQRNVTAEIAVLLAEMFDMSPAFWCKLAMDFDLWHALQAHRKKARAMSQGCSQCANGWQCEEHEGVPWPHDDCAGPGVPCENPECPWWRDDPPAALRPPGWKSIASVSDSEPGTDARPAKTATGLVCPACRRPVAIVENRTERSLIFQCPECGHRWSFLTLRT